jgi:hypothetical protein
MTESPSIRAANRDELAVSDDNYHLTLQKRIPRTRQLSDPAVTMFSLA